MLCPSLLVHVYKIALWQGSLLIPRMTTEVSWTVTIMASAAAEALEHLRRAIQLLHQLGFLINFKKLVLTPAQSISFLGFRAMEMRVPPKKIRKLRQECTKLLLQPRVTVRTLACRLGRLTSLSTGLLTAPLRYRHQYVSFSIVVVNGPSSDGVWHSLSTCLWNMAKSCGCQLSLQTSPRMYRQKLFLQALPLLTTNR